MHEFEPIYESLEISHESNHIKQVFQTFTRVNGKPPRLSKTPGAPHAFTYADESKTFGDNKASVYRSLAGARFYFSHDRQAFNFCAEVMLCAGVCPQTGQVPRSPSLRLFHRGNTKVLIPFALCGCLQTYPQTG